MPTEHEYKFVIRKDALELAKKLAKRVQDIEQGYTVFSKGISARVRLTTTNDKTRYYFTYKQKVAGRVVELEHEIDKRDGKDLWSSCLGKLKKTRYVVQDDLKWEIDFFYDSSGSIYFAMAEVEVDEDCDSPQLPKFISNNLIYEVALTDDRFANKKLGDVEYAKDLYDSLVKKKE